MTRRLSVGYIYFSVVIATLILRASSAIYSSFSDVGADVYFTCVVQLLIFGVMPLFLYWVTVVRNESGSLAQIPRDFGARRLSGRNSLRTALLAVCMIVVASGFSYMWQILLQMMGFVHVSSPTDYSGVDVLFRELVLVAVLPAVFEEISHRGLLYAGYRECGWKFALISALLFSLMHQNIVQTGYTFLDGVVMALAMYYTGSIFPGMFMHFLNNAWSVISGYIAQNGGAFEFVNVVDNWLRTDPVGMGVSVVMVVLCAGLAMLMLVRMRKDAVREGRVKEAFSSPAGKLPLALDPPFVATVAVGVIATLFSFAWGMMR